MRVVLSIVGILLGVALAGLLLGVVAGAVWFNATDEDPEPVVVEAPEVDPEGSPGAGAAATAPPVTPTFAPTPTPFVPIELAGDGPTSEPVSGLTPGIVVVTLAYDGEGRFNATLQRGEGEPVAQLANGQGPWQGSRAILLREGQQATLEIDATGPWRVTFDRPTPDGSEVFPLPWEASGSGSRALYYVEVPQGKHTLTATHRGEGRFEVTIMNDAGRMRSQPIDVEGPYEGSVEIEGAFFPTAFVIVDVRSDGEWTLRIE